MVLSNSVLSAAWSGTSGVSIAGGSGPAGSGTGAKFMAVVCSLCCSLLGQLLLVLDFSKVGSSVGHFSQ